MLSHDKSLLLLGSEEKKRAKKKEKEKQTNKHKRSTEWRRWGRREGGNEGRRKVLEEYKSPEIKGSKCRASHDFVFQKKIT